MIWLWTNSPSSPHTALCYTLTALPLLWFFCFWILQDLPHLDNSSSLFPWWTSLVAQMVKRLPIMWRTCVQSLGRKEPLAKKMATHWKWQPTPVRLPGKSHGWRSVVGHSPRGCKESDTTEQHQFHFHFPWYSSKDHYFFGFLLTITSYQRPSH